MVGLVNAVGVAQASRAAATAKAVTTPTERAANLAPILVAEAAAHRVLTTAVESIEFQEARLHRRTDDEEQSQEFSRADSQTRTTPPGAQLDVVA